ncbi:leucine-rich repeat domain-containing protein [uncultured Adlercreutzia sp.]|uniref:leucine-rich repeat domain-containing protein n=1 Tax=uncultured Adlercreutzia sp. TaxID=875803 RepID=UPI0025CD7F14|nr:leucine-rich repeat domain-containing protein [uncultured Adlercreutzia sp.]MCI9261633.1 leucine-rich repeat domain-containing protein [Eggerthellaceae bacterium]
MDIQAARDCGAVVGTELVSIEPLIEQRKYAVIPYGVTAAREGSLSKGRGMAIYLPETLTEFQGDPCTRHWEHTTLFVSYEGEDVDCDQCPPNPSELDLRFVTKYGIFPPLASSIYADKDRHMLAQADFVADTILGGGYPIELTGDSTRYTVLEGMLYDKEVETLLYCPTLPKPLLPKLPKTVTTLAKNSFYLARLKVWAMKSSVKRIEAEAFRLAHGARVELPKGVLLETYEHVRESFLDGRTVEHRGAFYCASIDEVTLPDDMRELPAGTFSESSLQRLSWPSSLETVGAEAFKGCRYLSLIVPDSVTEIGESAYTGMRSVSLPAVMADDWRSSLGCAGDTLVAIRDGKGGYCFATYVPKDGIAKSLRPLIEGGLAFQKTDELFKADKITGFEDKIRVALVRLCTTGDAEARPAEEMRSEYAAYVKKNAKKAAKHFEETGEIVGLSMLESLGYGATAAKKTAKEEPEKPKKPSPAVQCAAVIKALRKGDESLLDDLAPIASKINPVSAGELLMFGAIKGNKATIDRLYDMFDSFEMPCIALSRALAAGNEETARALIARGATLQPTFEPWAIKGDTESKQENRKKKYLDKVLIEDGLKIPGRCGTIGYHDGYLYFMALSNKSDGLIARLAADGLLSTVDLKGLIMAALVDSGDCYRSVKLKQGLAKKLYKIAAQESASVPLVYQDARQSHWHAIEQYEGILYPGCATETVEAVCAVMPDRVAAMWDPGFIRYLDAAKKMVAYLDPETFSNTAALLNLFAKNGCTDEIRIMEKRGFAVTEKMRAGAAALAREAGFSATAQAIEALGA